MIRPRPDAAPTVVMLHEGLASAATWGSFPDQIAAATGAGVFVYSRAGYGQSSPGTLPRSAVFHARRSDRSAAARARGNRIPARDFPRPQRRRVNRHRLCRRRAGRSRARAGSDRAAFFHRGYRASPKSAAPASRSNPGRFAKNSAAGTPTSIAPSAPGTSHGSHPQFGKWDITEALGYIRVPILIVQGEDDQFGTVKQIETAQRECSCPVETTAAARRAPRAAARSSGTDAQCRDRLHQSAAARPPRRRSSRPIPGLPPHEL